MSLRSSILLLALLAACGDDTSPTSDAGTDATLDAPTDGAAEDSEGSDSAIADGSVDTAFADSFVPTDAAPIECAAPDFGPALAWRHSIASPLTVAAGSSHHSTQGPIARVGDEFPIPGKFAYGLISKDLQGEDVRAFVRTSLSECTWLELGPEETDSDGRAILMAPPIDEPGLYEYILLVSGDLTTARGVIAVLAEDTELVVFDIDGTLTTDDGEVFEEVLLGGTAEMMEGAPALVRFYAGQGIQPIYITGRPYQLQATTREWLATQDIPLGPLHTTDSVLSTIPGSRTEDYKRDYLQLLVDAGFNFAAAYGNATSDICAYAAVGIPPARTFIIGPNAGMACDGFAATQAVEDYPSHLADLEAGL